MTTDKLIIFDTTLRDGEQSPGASMTKDEKLRIARQLERLKVDVIEAGLRGVEPNGDFEAVKAIADHIKDSIVCSLSRANDRDISRAAEALKGAARSRIHTFIATSALHMEKKLRMTPDQVFEQAKLAVRFARNLNDDVEFSPEDGYRSEPDFLCRVLEAVIKPKARRRSTCPTPSATRCRSCTASSSASLRERMPNSDKAVWSGALPQRPRHGGGQLAGRRQDRRCAPGRVHDQRPRRARRQHLARGSRDGGEDAARLLRPRRWASTRRRSSPASRMVSQTTGFVVQPNKAVVGANAFAHASGIHQDGVLKARDTYEIMRAEDVGWAANKIVLGKLSGRNAFKQRLQETGHRPRQRGRRQRRFRPLQGPGRPQERNLRRGHHRPGRRRERDPRAGALPLADNLEQRSGTGERPHARVAFAIGEQEWNVESDGNGPVDASLKAIESKAQSGAELVLYSVNAITSGSTESQGEVTVRLQLGGRVVNGVGADPDIVVASAKAYLAALNKLHSKIERVAAQG